MKDKPRHNPDKRQNKAGGDGTCMWWDKIGRGHICEMGLMWDKYCDGNPHKCKKAELKFRASLPDNRKDLDEIEDINFEC